MDEVQLFSSKISDIFSAASEVWLQLSSPSTARQLRFLEYFSFTRNSLFITIIYSDFMRLRLWVSSNNFWLILQTISSLRARDINHNGNIFFHLRAPWDRRRSPSHDEVKSEEFSDFRNSSACRVEARERTNCGCFFFAMRKCFNFFHREFSIFFSPSTALGILVTEDRSHLHQLLAISYEIKVEHCLLVLMVCWSCQRGSSASEIN